MADGIYLATSGAVAQLQQLDSVANNLANASSHGFKADQVAFSQVLARAQQPRGAAPQVSFVRADESRLDLRPGVLRSTGRPEDIALEGRGFVALRHTDGKVVYSRGGPLRVDTRGLLVDGNGLPLLDDKQRPLEVGQAGRGLKISDSGVVSTQDGEVGTLALVEFGRPAALTRIGNGLYGGARAQPGTAAATRVHQGHLEASNVNPVQGMSALITASRAYETFHKVISTFQTIDRRAAALGEER